KSDGKALEMYVLQNLEEIFGKVADAARRLTVHEVNLVDSGDGATLPAYLAAYPAAIGKLLSEVSETLGVDVARIVGGDGDGAESPSPVTARAHTAPQVG